MKHRIGDVLLIGGVFVSTAMALIWLIISQ